MTTFDPSQAKDQVNYTTITGFAFWDRIRILFGKQLTINSVIYTNTPVDVLGSTAAPAVARLFNPQQIQMVIKANVIKAVDAVETEVKTVASNVVTDIKDDVAKL